MAEIEKLMGDIMLGVLSKTMATVCEMYENCMQQIEFYCLPHIKLGKIQTERVREGESGKGRGEKGIIRYKRHCN